MAGFARLASELGEMIVPRRILGRTSAELFRRQVAVEAGIFLMLARQRIVGLGIVVEAQILLPAHAIAMTAFAGQKRGGHPISFFARKAVIVGVAAIAVLFQSRPTVLTEPLRGEGRRLLMAFCALDLSMLTPQVEACDPVIEVGQLPAVLIVTARTIAIAEFGTDFVAVLILVAAEAFGRFELGPFVLVVILPL